MYEEEREQGSIKEDKSISNQRIRMRSTELILLNNQTN